LDKKYDVMGFGEAMVRMSSPEHLRLEQSSHLNLAIAAAELNCCVNIARLGLKTAYVTKLADTWSGKYIVNHGRAHGVDMSNVLLEPYDGCGKTRNGLCFIEVGIGPRASRQIYDRGHSAVSKVSPEDFDWANLLAHTRWYHTTGITTAISENAAEQAVVSLKTAKQLGVVTSFDLNFRSTLWTSEKARETMAKVMPYVDVVIGNEEDFDQMLGIKAEGVGEGYSKIDPESYRAVAEKVVRAYPNVIAVGTTLREVKTALLNDWRTVMMFKGSYYVSRKYENIEIFDRTGGGDSFASAMIYGILENQEPQYIVDFSAAYSALCHTFMGDWNWAYKEEAEGVMRGESARVKR
jgi:2-dehydro-3-deoxygluconokinase